MSIFLFIIALTSIEAISLMQGKENSQLFMCPDGQAVSSIAISGGKCKAYSITCSTVSSACHQKCQWSSNCTRSKDGPNNFLGGLVAVCNPATEEQQLYFLCCNNFRTLSRVCFTGLQRLEPGSPTFYGRASFLEAMSNRSDGSVGLYAERCYHRISHDKACPPEAMKKEVSIDENLRVDPSLLSQLGLVKTPKALETKQRFQDHNITCRAGQAVSVLWREVGVAGTNYFEYKIICTNFTELCDEICEYAFACTSPSLYLLAYVKGIWDMYNVTTGIQRLLFLCCTIESWMIPDVECSDTVESVQTHPPTVHNNNNKEQLSFLGDAWSAYSRLHGSISHRLNTSTRTCVQDRTEVQLCPLSKAHRDIPPVDQSAISEDVFSAGALAALVHPIVDGVVPPVIGTGLAFKKCCCTVTGDACNAGCVCPGFQCLSNLCARTSG